jgi:ADP-ribosylglycohydrolase
VPEAIIAFLDADSYEDALRNAVSLGGDSDTLACIAGAIAAAFHGGVPAPIRDQALARLAPDLREIAEAFVARYPASG